MTWLPSLKVHNQKPENKQHMSHRDHSPKRKCHVTLEVKAAQELTLEGNNFNAQWWQAGCHPKELVVRMRSILPGNGVADEPAKEYILEENVPFVKFKPDTSKWEDALLEARDNCDKILESHLTVLIKEHDQNLDRIREQFASRIKEEDQLHEMRANALRADHKGRLDWLHEQEQVIKALDKREGHWGPGDWPNYRMPLNLKDTQEDWWENDEEEPQPQKQSEDEGKQAIVVSEHSSSACDDDEEDSDEDDDEDSDDEEILDNLDLLDRYEMAREKGNDKKSSRIAGIMSDRMEKEEDPDIMMLITDGDNKAKGKVWNDSKSRVAGGRSKSSKKDQVKESKKSSLSNKSQTHSKKSGSYRSRR